MATTLQVVLQSNVDKVGETLPEELERSLHAAWNNLTAQANEDFAQMLGGFFEEFDRAGADQHAALRESDDLHRQRLPEIVARTQNTREPAEPHLGVDVDEGADVRRAGGDHQARDAR